MLYPCTRPSVRPEEADLKPASEGVRPMPVRGEKKTEEDATEPERLGAVGVSSTRGACTEVVMRTGASAFGRSPSMPSTCKVVSNSCKRKAQSYHHASILLRFSRVCAMAGTTCVCLRSWCHHVAVDTTRQRRACCVITLW